MHPTVETLRSSPPILTLEEVSCVRAGRLIVNSVSLSVPRRQRLVLLGESGAGKSTLLNIIAGLLPHTSGHLKFADDLSSPNSIGYVFQTDGLFPHMTVFENVAFPLLARNWDKKQAEMRVEELLGTVGVSALRSSKPGSLSGGERQRVALARAFSYRPAILLLDEPFSSLDFPLRRRLREMLLDAHKTELFTLIMVTHDPIEATHVGEQIVVLADGKIVGSGSGSELYWQAPSTYVASLLGPCNQIRINIESEGHTRIASIGEYQFELPTVVLPEARGGGTLLVRPQSIRIKSRYSEFASTDRTQCLGWLGNVTTLRDAGSNWIVRMVVDFIDSPIEVHVQTLSVECLPKIGEVVACDVSWQQVHWLSQS